MLQRYLSLMYQMYLCQQLLYLKIWLCPQFLHLKVWFCPTDFWKKKFCVYFCIEISYSYDILLYWSTGAGEIDKKIDEDDKINIRASLILRPRAVLSSPGNFT